MKLVKTLQRRSVEELRSLISPRAKALIMTFWGDMLLPFGGRIWLGSLVQAMAPLGLDEQLVRTSVHRLVSEGWLTSTTIGRKRELCMPVQRLKELRLVQNRMYRAEPLDWDGRWRIVVVQPSSPARREILRRELRWQGYAILAPNTVIHPRQDWPELSLNLRAKGLLSEIGYAFTAEAVPAIQSIIELWPLDKIRSQWTGVIELLEIASALPKMDSRSAFAVRLLIVHALRLAVLRDPALPKTLLPENWPERTARKRLWRFYDLHFASAREYLEETVRTANGSVPMFDSSEISWRFGRDLYIPPSL